MTTGGMKEFRTKQDLLRELCNDRVSYRHTCGLLDPNYDEWRPEGRPEVDIAFINQSALVVSGENLCTVIGVPSEVSSDAIAKFVNEKKVDELTVLGEEAFSQIKPHLTKGVWRISLNYRGTRESFTPKESSAVQRLTAEDRPSFEALLDAEPLFGNNPSSKRDFGYMEQGLPVTCYGAFEDERLVAFCSANPICDHVTEISWLFVSPSSRGRGYGSGLLTAQMRDAFDQGNDVGYFNGGGCGDVDRLVQGVGFQPIRSVYRFVPNHSEEQWRTSWGIPV